MVNGKRKTPTDRRITFRATEYQWKRLGTVQQRTGATPSEQIRRGLELWLKQQEAGR